MKAAFLALPVLVLVTAALPAAAADCVYPRVTVKIPDGNKATKPEMQSAIASVKEYQTAMTQYLDCIKAEHDAALAAQAASLTEEQKKQLTLRFNQKNDAAVDELQDIEMRMREQRQVWLDANKKK